MKTHGILRNFDHLRNYGFIAGDDDRSYFVAEREFERAGIEPRQHMRLAFNSRPGRKETDNPVALELEAVP